MVSVVYIIPPEAVVVGERVPLVTGYGALVTKVELEKPPDALVVSGDEAEVKLLTDVDEVDELTRIEDV